MVVEDAAAGDAQEQLSDVGTSPTVEVPNRALAGLLLVRIALVYY